MAENTKPTINSVTTFVAAIEKPAIGIVLKGFTGNQTPRTLAAARRIRAKKEKVKIPRNLLRQLWRITGGWNEGRLQTGWGSQTGEPTSSRSTGTQYWKAVKLGDLMAIMSHDGNSYLPCLLLYRGKKVARLEGDWQKEVWLNASKMRDARDTLGVDWNP